MTREIETVVAADDLRQFAESLCMALGSSERVAGEVAAHLIQANLAGHDSHGVARLIQHTREVEAGELDPTAEAVLLTAHGALSLWDARRGFGQYSTMQALRWCMDRAPDTGIAAAAIRHSTHIGRLGHYAEAAAGAGLVAIVLMGVAGDRVGGVAPPGTAARRLAANPLAIGIPSGNEPVVVDVSMAAVAEGKLRVARDRGDTAPEGLIVDRNGEPTSKPEDFYGGGAILPLGAPTVPHKGFGLGLGLALLGGLAMIGDPDPTLVGVRAQPGSDPQGRIGGVVVVVIDPEPLGGGGVYRELVADAVEAVADAGHRRITLPGDPENRARATRSQTGIPIPRLTWQELTELSGRLGVELPGVRHP